MKVINLTPHDVSVCDNDGNIIKTYEKTGTVARVSHTWKECEYIDDIIVVERFGEHVINLPESQEETLYIVSNIVLDYCRNERSDLISPVQQVKINGRVVGCRAFCR